MVTTVPIPRVQGEQEDLGMVLTLLADPKDYLDEGHEAKEEERQRPEEKNSTRFKTSS